MPTPQDAEQLVHAVTSHLQGQTVIITSALWNNYIEIGFCAHSWHRVVVVDEKNDMIYYFSKHEFMILITIFNSPLIIYDDI